MAARACSEATDQRYVARPQGVTCDIGAFELDRFATRDSSRSSQTSPSNPKTGVATVTGTATCSEPAVVGVDVALSQTQKTTGKFSTTIQADGDDQRRLRRDVGLERDTHAVDGHIREGRRRPGR